MKLALENFSCSGLGLDTPGLGLRLASETHLPNIADRFTASNQRDQHPRESGIEIFGKRHFAYEYYRAACLVELLSQHITLG